jgi:type IV pilus assembly protein PilW
MNRAAASPTAPRAQAGFTLIELMVAMVIGLFIVAGVGGVYIASKRSFWATHAITSMDDTARAVFDLMGMSIRQAGFDGCQQLAYSYNGDTRNVNTNQWWNNVGAPVQAYVAPAPNFTSPAPVPGTGVLTLVGVDPTREAYVISDNPAAGVITTGAHSFTTGQTLLATSCRVNSFFMMTGGDGGNIIAHGTNGNPGNCNTALGFTCGDTAVPVAFALPAGASILPVVTTAWFAAPSANAAKGNSLWQASTANLPGAPVADITTAPSAIELVNGVENLAFDFGLDPGGSGSITQWRSTNNVTNWNQVMAVRVHLLLSTLPDSATAALGNNIVNFNGQQLTETTTPVIDPRRIYREYTSVFTIRNRL